MMPGKKQRAGTSSSGQTRRQIIKFTGATAALSGITASSQPASGFATNDQEDDSGTTFAASGGAATNEGDTGSDLSTQWTGGDAKNDEGTGYSTGNADPNDDGTSETDFQSGTGDPNDGGAPGPKPTIITQINILLKNNTHIAEWVGSFMAIITVFITIIFNKSADGDQ